MRELNYLVKKLKNGEQKYFKEFYDRTKTGVFYLVKKTLGNHSLHAEDVMQEVYVTFLNKLPVIDDNKNYKAYLLSIAKSKSLDEIKKHLRIDKSVEIADLPFSVTDNELSDFPLMEYCKTKLTEEEFRLLELSVVYGFNVSLIDMTDDELDALEDYYEKHNVSDYEKNLITEFKQRVIKLAEKKIRDANALIEKLSPYCKDSDEIIQGFPYKEEVLSFVNEYKTECNIDFEKVKYEDVNEFCEELTEIAEELAEEIEEINEESENYGELLEDLIELVKEKLFEED